MKLILTSLLIIVGLHTYSQQCNEKHILTGPVGSYGSGITSPVNQEQPSNTSFFNWRLNPLTDGIQFRFTPVNGTTKYLLSPWHVSDPNIDYYKLAKGTNSDYNPSDGWEIFKVNLGRLNDDITMRLSPTLVPYIMLYNRYTGILRVFGFLDRTSDYHQMVITMGYDNPTPNNGLSVSALLSINDRIQQPLDAKTTTKQIKAVSNYSNNQYIFFWADFPLAYDPCVCLYKSNLTIQFTAVVTANLNLTGSIIGKMVPIATSPTGTAAKFLSSVLNIAKGIYTANYADFANAATNILGLTNLNSDIQRGLSIFTNTIQLGLTINQINNDSSQTNINKPRSDKEKTEQTLSAITTFFSALSKSGSSNTMAFTGSTILNGSSLQEFSFQNSPIRFSTPGSKDSHLNPQENYNNITDTYGNVRPEYINYNEILGTFALLKKPIVNISYQPINTNPPMVFNPNNPFYVQLNRIRFSVPKTYTSNGITYSNNIMYAINPIMHPNYNNTIIKSALVIRKKMGGCTNISNSPLSTGVYNNYPLVNLASVTATYPNMDEIITPLTYDGYEIYDYLHQWQSGANWNGECNTYEFTTPLVPLKFIYDLQGEMTIFGSNFTDSDIWGFPFDPKVDEILIKFLIEFESSDIGTGGTANKSTLVFTYPVQINQVTEFPINGFIDFTQYRPDIAAVSQTDLNQFCTNQLVNSTYLAKELSEAPIAMSGENGSINKADYKGVSLKITPNPTNGEIQIYYKIDQETPISISVYNLMMQKIAKDISLSKQEKGNHTQKIALNNLSPGVYIVQLKTNEKTISTRVIVTR